MHSLFYPIPGIKAGGLTSNSHKNPRQNHQFLATTCVFKNPGVKDGSKKCSNNILGTSYGTKLGVSFKHSKNVPMDHFWNVSSEHSYNIPETVSADWDCHYQVQKFRKKRQNIRNFRIFGGNVILHMHKSYGHAYEHVLPSVFQVFSKCSCGTLQ